MRHGGGVFQFNYQISVSDLILIGGGILAFMKVFISTRDVQRDLATIVRELRDDVDRIDRRQDKHHEWLIANGLDRRLNGLDRRTSTHRTP